MNALCLALAAAAAQPGPCPQAPGWRSVATEADRQRLRDARATWTEALAQAQPVSSDPLVRPDEALDDPLPPPGAYRCRLVKLGGAAGFAERDWGRCEVGRDSLVKLDGPQRPMGRLYPDSEMRAVFLGTLMIGDEVRPLRYGRDRRRDLVGVVEHIGDARWRVVLPRPGFESTLDLLELRPS